MRGQLTLRGIIIGCIGCAIITASSIYTALKMGALPWPIIFTAIVSLFFLRLISRNTSSLNEVNVTHTVMSSGAMIAGGLAFTIPGAWMMGLASGIDLMQMLVIAFSGSAMGLIGSILLRRHFIEDAKLEFPIGEAAAQTLKAGDAGGKVGIRLFGSMGLAALYCFLRDGLKLLPSMFCQLNIPGVAFGIYNSPLMLAVGFLVGVVPMCVWFAGSLIANFGIITGFPMFGICDTSAAQTITSSLGMGIMVGCGFAVVAKDIIPKGIIKVPKNSVHNCGIVVVFAACIILLLCIFLEFPIWVSIFVVFATFITCIMSGQSVGQTGIDPMEIFGLIVLLIVAIFAQIDQLKLFFVAALVAVACGLSGDVMNDFKAGHIIGTNPRAQWIGQAIGAVVGSIVAVLALQVLLNAYGPDAFGQGAEFVSAQANIVATMVGGIPNVAAFATGLILGFLLYLFKFPAMMLGLGVYLPFYLSFSAFLGCLVRMAFNMVCTKKANKAYPNNKKQAIAASTAASKDVGLIVASGILGGESVMGIILALAITISAFI